MGGFVAFLGFVAVVIGVVSLIKGGIPALRLANRNQSVVVIAAGIVAFFGGAVISGPTNTQTRSQSRHATDKSPSLSFSPSPSPSPSPTPAFATQQSSVTRVIDGDTAEMRLADGKQEDVRFIGVDTQERGRPYFNESSGFTTQAIGGKTVFLELDVGQRDRYGRLLAYVWLTAPLTGSDQEARASLFNAKLLLDGYAQVLTVPPNVKYSDAFLRYQQVARDAGRGLWGLEPSREPSPTKKVDGNVIPVTPTSVFLRRRRTSTAPTWGGRTSPSGMTFPTLTRMNLTAIRMARGAKAERRKHDKFENDVASSNNSLRGRLR